MRAKAEPPNPDPPGTPMSPFVCVLYRHWLTYYCNLRINIAMLIFIFNLRIKTATVYSIVMIFFSQLSKIVISISHLDQLNVNLTTLLCIFVASICGGYIGASVSKRMNSKDVLLIYRIVVVLVIAMNIGNALRVLIA